LLEIDRGLAEVLRARRRVGEVERRRRSRLAAEPFLQQRDVIVLLRRHDARVGQQLTAQLSAAQSGVVEARLGELEDEQEAQDAYVLGLRRPSQAGLGRGPAAEERS